MNGIDIIQTEFQYYPAKIYLTEPLGVITLEQLLLSIKDTGSKLRKVFNFNTEKFEDAFYGNTCMIKDKQIISYHIDVLNALKCGIENRYINNYEWD